jgi:hypothetical protein
MSIISASAVFNQLCPCRAASVIVLYAEIICSCHFNAALVRACNKYKFTADTWLLYCEVRDKPHLTLADCTSCANITGEVA